MAIKIKNTEAVFACIPIEEDYQDMLDLNPIAPHGPTKAMPHNFANSIGRDMDSVSPKRQSIVYV